MQIDVKFDDGRKWSFNPDLVQKYDEAPNVKPAFPNRRKEAASNIFKANDIVKVIADVKRFEQLQKDAGLWQDWLGRVSGSHLISIICKHKLKESSATFSHDNIETT